MFRVSHAYNIYVSGDIQLTSYRRGSPNTARKRDPLNSISHLLCRGRNNQLL